MIDTHAHLDACDEPAGTLVERARRAGVTTIVTIGTGIDSCRAALAIAEKEDAVVAALGIDPHRAATPEAHRVDELRALLAHPRVVAVGETGLDAHHGADTMAEQLALFEQQLALAADVGLPIVVHCREAAAATADLLAAFPGTVILHCFSEPDLLAPAVDNGWYVSFAGNVTYPRAGVLRDAAASVSRDRVLVETDSPYLSPQPVRGRRNEPANVVHTLGTLAEARGEDASALERAIDANARIAFGL
ncbi:MAG: TatD family hydrolase [Thermoleophilia bacterium]|nr:TatD family hydrolase [Thermoleophilia bacterium]MDH5333051.1 TatD family hydrolase [Thermoleophilia bacterium]